MTDLPRDIVQAHSLGHGEPPRSWAIDRIGDLSRDVTRAQCVGWMALRLENP